MVARGMRRYVFPGISATEAGCTACGALFIDAPSFDIHRGIRPQGRRSDEAQDRGSCMNPDQMRKAGLQQEGERWGSEAAIARVRRMASIRESR